MTDPDPDKFNKWLFAKLAEYELSEYIPHDDLMKVSAWAAKSFYQNGSFQTKGFIAGLNKDYGYPLDQLLGVLGYLKNDAVHIGVEVLIPTEDELEEASSDNGPGARSIPSPKFHDPYKNLTGFMQDRKYMGWALLDHINDRATKKAPLIQVALTSHFSFSEEEQNLLRSIDSNTPADSLPGLVLAINSLALAYCFAMDFSKSQSELDIKNMLLSLRLMDTTFGELAGTVMMQLSNANKDGRQEEARVLDRAWKRLQALQEDCESVKKKLQNTQYESSSSSHHGGGQKHKTDTPQQPKKKGGWLSRLKGK